MGDIAASLAGILGCVTDYQCEQAERLIELAMVTSLAFVVTGFCILVALRR